MDEPKPRPRDPHGVDRNGAQRITRAQYAQVALQITAASKRRTASQAMAGASGEATASEDDFATPRALDKRYIRKRVREILPLLQECYEDETPEQNRPIGELKVRLVIEGDPSIGGIVSESEIIGGSLAGERELTKCITETAVVRDLEGPSLHIQGAPTPSS